MRILVVALNYSPEIVGCAKFTSEMVKWLSKKSNKIIVITTNPFYETIFYQNANWKLFSSFQG